MNPRNRLSTWAIAALLLALTATAYSAGPDSDDAITALVGATVIDGTGAAPRAQQTILIQGDRISAIGNAADIAVPAHAKKIDLGGKYILPGFIDLHVHLTYPPDAFPQSDSLATLRAVHFMERFRKAGVTSLRDVAGTVESMQALLQAQQLGYIDSSRLFPVGKLITSTGGHGTPWGAEFASGADGFREAVRKMDAAGFRDVKLSPQYTQEEVSAAVDEAKTRGMRVTSHGGGYSDAVPPIMTRRAIDAGVHSIEHFNDMPDDVLRDIAKRGIQIVPTMAIYRVLYDLPVRPATLDSLVRERGWSLQMHEEIFKKAMKLGVVMGIGTDAVATILDTQYPGLYFDELKYFVQLGMSRLDTIKAASLNGALILGRDKDLGSLEAGKFADLQVISGNPLDNFDLLGTPELVMIAGKIKEQ